MMKFTLLLIAVAAVVSAQEDIPTTAINAGSFTTLVAALQATDLVAPLSAPNGPFTVFAPNDDAFAALPAGMVDCLLLEENRDFLTSLLNYHVANGQVQSSDLTDGQLIPTLNGAELTVNLTNGVMINDVSVITPDVATSNGVIHIVDSVIVPPGTDVDAFLATCPTTEDIPTVATEAGSFKTLVAALSAADLVETLSEPNGPFTVFAPTDDAFAALPEGLVNCLLIPENKDVLSTILTYHVVDGAVRSTNLTDGQVVETLNGSDLTVDLSDGVKINDATVSQADVEASNGIIHIIDSVLVPADIDVTAFLATCPKDTSSAIKVHGVALAMLGAPLLAMM